MSYSERAAAIFSVLADRPVAYHPGLARVLGVKEAIFVCQLLYWHGKGKLPGGWIWKTQADITEEIGLSRREQEGARRRLVAAGILEEDLRGVPATMHYRLNLDTLAKIAETAFSMHQTAKLDCTKPPNLYGAFVQTIPESTAEITPESTGEALPPPAPPSERKPIAKTTKEPPSEAAKVYHEVAAYWPPGAWKGEVAAVTDLDLWRRIVKDWIGLGWNKQNVKGMLEFYARGETPRAGGGNGHKRGRNGTNRKYPEPVEATDDVKAGIAEWLASQEGTGIGPPV